MGAFMLSDAGDYPTHIREGRDFVAYKNKSDLIDKITYFIKNEEERKAIAQSGYETIKQHYNVTKTAANLEQIFSNL
jgi:spore maturation protein CgeB